MKKITALGSILELRPGEYRSALGGRPVSLCLRLPFSKKLFSLGSAGLRLALDVLAGGTASGEYG